MARSERDEVVWASETSKFAGVSLVSLPEQTSQLLRGFLVKHADDSGYPRAGISATVRPVFFGRISCQCGRRTA